ncbi:hypothetical protein SAMN04487948_102281 [Halogranum amylolyticum]|uniref:Uncharacterized protein n=1 Tax=Halogranum amylolyticum TaxID=660520 RepID=A0A1H8PGF6_9EURY|nr:hypothetical protein [Halogranum amylolyticum]SEO40881.1 hypothetical protein SAMN04487948_102281 [Halogranum amylolyticum]
MSSLFRRLFRVIRIADDIRSILRAFKLLRKAIRKLGRPTL